MAIEEAARLVSEGGEPVVVDLCTGSGAIALAVATEVPAAWVHAVELSESAVGTARSNVAAAGLLAHPLDLRRGDAATAFADLAGAVDVVVSNPPYIPPDAVPQDPEVRDHDPDLALYGGGADGLAVPRAVVATAARLLRPGGLLVMEHAEVQAAAVRAAVAATGAFGPATTRVDLTGRDRMATARRLGRGGALSRPQAPAGARGAAQRRAGSTSTRSSSRGTTVSQPSSARTRAASASDASSSPCTT